MCKHPLEEKIMTNRIPVLIVINDIWQRPTPYVAFKDDLAQFNWLYKEIINEKRYHLNLESKLTFEQMAKKMKAQYIQNNIKVIEFWDELNICRGQFRSYVLYDEIGNGEYLKEKEALLLIKGKKSAKAYIGDKEYKNLNEVKKR